MPTADWNSSSEGIPLVCVSTQLCYRIPGAAQNGRAEGPLGRPSNDEFTRVRASYLEYRSIGAG